jgi:secondary thiamine-phosphate synthase enzyme
MVTTTELFYDSEGNAHIIDITSDVREIIIKSKLNKGQVLVFIPGATASVTTLECEDGLIEDFKDMFKKLIPEDDLYAHHDDNGCSHVRAGLLGPSLNVPFHENKMLLGTWQSIVVVDFDNRPRKRRVIVQVVGE